MIRPDGTTLISRCVVLKHENRDLWVIERSELRRVFIQGSELHWLTKSGIEYSVHVGEAVAEIFDAITTESGDVVFEEYREAPAEYRWRRLGVEANPRVCSAESYGLGRCGLRQGHPGEHEWFKA